MMVETLVPPVPHQWTGLFTALRSDRPLQRAEMWIKEELVPHYGDHVSTQWQALLQFLSDVVIVSGRCKVLRLMSVQSYLPSVLQRNLLAVIFQHRGDVSKDVLREFVEKVNHCDTSLTWTNLLWKLLSGYVGIDTEKTPNDLPVDVPKLETPKICNKIETESFPGPPEKLIVEALERDIGESERDGETKRDPLPGPDGEECIIILDEDEDMTGPSPAKKIKVEEAAVVKNANSLPSSSKMCGLEQELLKQGKEFHELLHSSPEDACSVMEALKGITKTPSDKLLTLWQACGLDGLPETGLEAVCGALVKMTDTISYSSCAAVISGLITHKLEALDQTASRLLQGMVISLAQTFPLQLLDAVLVESLVKHLGAPQSEILCRLCKDCLSKSHQAHLLRKLVEGDTVLTEPALAVLHSVLEAKPDLTETHITAILDCLSKSAEDFKNNLKFGKLLLSFVNKYAKQWTRIQISTMNQISGRHKTFLSKKIDSSLKKMYS